MKRLVFVLGALSCVSSCLDVGEAHPPAPGVQMELVDMYGHVNQLFDFKFIDKNNFVQMHGKILPLRMSAGQFKVFIPRAVPEGATGYRVDFWADENFNLEYDFDHNSDFSKQDHSWRVSLDDGAPADPFVNVKRDSATYLVQFKHNVDLVDLNQLPDRGMKNPPKDTGTDAIIHIDNLAPHDGKLVQVRISDPSGHTVGLFRFNGSAKQSTWTIEGCVERGNVYDVDLYIDANGDNDSNGHGYDNPARGPGNDLGWRLRKPADATGLDVRFDAADGATGNVDVGPL